MSELNERAARAMGWERSKFTDQNIEYYWETNCFPDPLPVDMWQPTKDIKQAWMPVEKCIEKGLFVDIRYDTMAWSVTVWKNGKTSDILELSLDNAAEAITRACVEALENENSR